MSTSDELRSLAESWATSGDIPSYVKHDLDTLAIDVSEIERERDERRIVTAQEHGRVVQVYIDMLSEKNEENAKLRDLCEDMYRQCGASMGYDDPLLEELGIEGGVMDVLGKPSRDNTCGFVTTTAYDKLKAENAKLREISADMLKCIKETKVSKSPCWKCPHHRDIDELRSACFLAYDAREFGIEVE